MTLKTYLCQCSNRSCAFCTWRAPVPWWHRWWPVKIRAGRCAAEAAWPWGWSSSPPAGLRGNSTTKTSQYCNKDLGVETQSGPNTLLGTPETRRRGLSTLKALSAFMSNPPPFSTGMSPIKWIVSIAKVKSLCGEKDDNQQILLKTWNKIQHVCISTQFQVLQDSLATELILPHEDDDKVQYVPTVP